MKASTEPTDLHRPLRLAFVGGAPKSWIGGMHRRAAELDGRWQLVGGVFSSNADRSREAAVAMGLDAARGYPDVTTMITKEVARADGIDAVAVMGPNDTHYAAAITTLDGGLDVVLDKPVSTTAAEARELAACAQANDRIVAVTHAYSAYPMTRQAKHLVANGTIGTVRMVQIEYIQNGTAVPVAPSAMTDRDRWRFDATRSGLALVFSAIGCHAQHLACDVAGLKVASVSADAGALVPDRSVIDTMMANIRFVGGARGQFMVTQAAAGGDNDIRLRVYGERGMFEWSHRESAYLKLNIEGESARVIGRSDPGLPPEIVRLARTPRGHPEGLLEAFANIYRETAEAIIARRHDEPLANITFPTITDGVHSMSFVEAALASHANNGAWTNLA